MAGVAALYTGGVRGDLRAWAAVVMSAAELESLEETLTVVSRPQLITQIRDSLAELAAGEAEVLSKKEILATLRA